MTLQWSILRARLDPVEGSEQAGSRPILIVSRESINQSLSIVTGLPLTTLKKGRRIYPTEVLLPKGTAGLAAPSLVMAHQIRTLARSRLERLYGTLHEPELRKAVVDAMRLYLDLDAFTL